MYIYMARSSMQGPIRLGGHKDLAKKKIETEIEITEGNLVWSELNVANELLDLTDHLMLEAPALLNEEGL